MRERERERERERGEGRFTLSKNAPSLDIIEVRSREMAYNYRIPTYIFNTSQHRMEVIMR